MNSDLQWVVGFVMVVVGIISKIFHVIFTRLGLMAKAREQGDNELHARISKTREEFVSQGDLDRSLDGITHLFEVRFDSLTKQNDRIIEAIMKDKGE